jgi:alkylhydroperoxidase family enzyme
MNGCAYCVDMHALDARAHGELVKLTMAIITINARREDQRQALDMCASAQFVSVT